MGRTWMMVEDFAVDVGLDYDEVLAAVRAGSLDGFFAGGRWFVEMPLVRLQTRPDLTESGAWLEIAACVLGNYVTAGRGQCLIRLGDDLDSIRAAIDRLNTALTSAPELPLTLTINGSEYLFDSSLWVDLGAALIEFVELVVPSDPEALSD